MATLVPPAAGVASSAGPRAFPAATGQPWGHPRGARHTVGQFERTPQFVIDTREEAPDLFTDAGATDWSKLTWKDVGRPYTVEKWSRAKRDYERSAGRVSDIRQMALYCHEHGMEILRAGVIRTHNGLIMRLR